MKGKKFIVFCVAVLSLNCFFPISTFADEEISNEKLENVALNCESIKQTLRRVQNIDKNARVSIGRSYQNILANYITPLNIRIIKNNQKENKLAEIQSDYVNAREKFNAEYIAYSQEFENLLKIDCKNEPKSFYDQLVATRQKRTDVAAASSKLREIIKNHIDEVKLFSETLEVKNAK
jgi:Asp-tRNA(Asn)/Glu-tRNA(Gln) amidotransferase C subunit